MDQHDLPDDRVVTGGAGVLEIRATREYVERVRIHFGLAEHEVPTDDQIRAFFCQNLKRALIEGVR